MRLAWRPMPHCWKQLRSRCGLPTPNLSTGEHNPHSPLEWTSLEEMEAAVAMLVQLATLWGRERVEA